MSGSIKSDNGVIVMPNDRIDLSSGWMHRLAFVTKADLRLAKQATECFCADSPNIRLVVLTELRNPPSGDARDARENRPFVGVFFEGEPELQHEKLEPFFDFIRIATASPKISYAYCQLKHARLALENGDRLIRILYRKDEE